MTARLRFPSAILAATLSIAPAHAASDADWAAFRADVETKCLAAAGSALDEPRAAVDPFGSESFGLAVVHGKAKGGSTPVAFICVYDKKTQMIEIGGELRPDLLPLAP